MQRTTESWMGRTAVDGADYGIADGADGADGADWDGWGGVADGAD